MTSDLKVGRVCSEAYIFFIFLETWYSADNKKNFLEFFCMHFILLERYVLYCGPFLKQNFETFRRAMMIKSAICCTFPPQLQTYVWIFTENT